MPGNFPTPSHVIDTLRNHLERMTGPVWPIDKRGTIFHEHAPHDVRRFDVTLSDGRVYRVRVSDITPEKETA